MACATIAVSEKVSATRSVELVAVFDSHSKSFNSVAKFLLVFELQGE